MKAITALALISLGIIFSVFLVQAIDLQSRIDAREAYLAHAARTTQ